MTFLSIMYTNNEFSSFFAIFLVLRATSLSAFHDHKTRIRPSVSMCSSLQPETGYLKAYAKKEQTRKPDQSLPTVMED